MEGVREAELRRRFKLALAMRMMQVHEDGMQDDTYGSFPFQQGNVRPPSSWEEYRESSESLSGFDAITIPDLRPSKQYCRGRVLYGKFCIEPFISQSSVNDIVTLLVDTNANAIRVIMSKLLWDTQSTREIELRFSLERRVAIKEPLVEICTDGMPGVRLMDLADVVCVENVNVDGQLAAESSDAICITLEKIRCQGNRFFAERNWAGAVNKYSQIVNEALRKLENNGSPETTIQDKLKYVLMLAYSNRAEARLRLQHYEDALSDADNALKIEAKHMKTLVRKGKAAHGLGLFEKACEAFKAALRESPEEQSVIHCLNATTTAFNQSCTGQYDLSAHYLGYGTEEVPSCADFIGPVEIRRVGYAAGRRGLFATRTVKAGELLLVSNPLAAVRQEVSVHPTLWTSRQLETFNTRISLIWEVANRIKTSKRLMAQLRSLCGHRRDEMAIPSMELFRPGSEWVPEDQDKFEIHDFDRIRDIACMNACQERTDSQFEDGATIEIVEAIWAIPSFANHSCAPNIICALVGDACFFRASVDILEGEEITISYFDESSFLWKGVEERRQITTEAWSVACKCARCILEERLQPKLSKIMINTGYPDLLRDFLDAAVAGFPKYQKYQRAVKDLAKVTDAIEAVLQSEKSELGSREQGWIRVSFLQAYAAKSQLARDEGNSQSIISSFRLLLDSTTSVSIGPFALRHAAALLVEVERRYSKRSQSYRLTLDRVLSVFKASFGNLPKDTLRKLIKKQYG